MNSQPPGCRVLVCCDASPTIGFGHVSRCLGLAEALDDHGIGCRFVGELDAHAQAAVTDAGFPLQLCDNWREPGELEALLTQSGADAIVIDSYDARLAERIADVAEKVFLIDDFCRLPAYPCHTVLNFTVGAHQLAYPQPGPKLLLGPGYLLLRRGLRQRLRHPKPAAAGPRQVLISLGGGQAAALSLEVLEALSDHTDRVAVRVALRAGTPPLALETAVQGFASGSTVLVGKKRLDEEYACADVCITGGGLAKYESAYLGIPTAVYSVNAEQAAETQTFANLGLACDLGEASTTTPAELRHALTRFLADTTGQKALVARSRKVFSHDPTQAAARAVQEMIHS